MSELHLSALNPLYRSLVDLIGEDNMMTIYEELRGQQLNFPMRLYDRKVVSGLVQREYNGKNLKQLSQEYGYSVRWVQSQIKVGHDRQNSTK